MVRPDRELLRAEVEVEAGLRGLEDKLSSWRPSLCDGGGWP